MVADRAGLTEERHASSYQQFAGRGAWGYRSLFPSRKMFAASIALAEGAPVSRIGLSQAVAVALNLLLEIAICRGLVADDWLRDTFELVEIGRASCRERV